MFHQLSDHELILKLKTTVKEERKLTVEVISYLQEVSDRKLYVEYKLDSLHKFCTRILGYSDTEASLRIKAVRVANKLPEVKKHIEENNVSLNSVAGLHHFIKENPTKDAGLALAMITGKSARVANDLLNEISDTPKARELNLKLSERFLKKLDIVRSAYENCGELEALEVLVDEKVRAINEQKPKRQESGSKNQRYIPRMAKETVFKMANYQCQKCGTRRNLNLDHIKPVAIGGKSNQENLRILCFACNQRQWIKMRRGDVLKT